MSAADKNVETGESPDLLRRRLTRGGLAVPVVLGSLGSKPVLGRTTLNCSPSGQLSGNLSYTGTEQCATGRSISQLAEQDDAYLDNAFNSVSAGIGSATFADAFHAVEPEKSCVPSSAASTPAFIGAPLSSGSKSGGTTSRRPRPGLGYNAPAVNSAPMVNNAPTVNNAAVADRSDLSKRAPRWSPRGQTAPASNGAPVVDMSSTGAAVDNNCNGAIASSSTASVGTQQPLSRRPRTGRGGLGARTTVVDRSAAAALGATRPATLREILQSDGGGNVPLGRAAIAAYLNAIKIGPSYGVTPEKVIEMFNATYNGGVYRVNESVSWDRQQVQAYFETLFRR